MTKQDVVNAIHDKTKVDKATVILVVESFMKIVKDTITDNKAIYLRGFGTFSTKLRAEKKARNIKAKKTITVPAHFIPAFKPSKAFGERVKKLKVPKEKK